MRLFLVRHGQTAWNLAGRAQGHTDIPLDELGMRQRDLVGRAFEGTKLSRVYTSDLARANSTAQAVAKATGAPILIRQDLRERCFGEWEGSSFLDVSDWTIEESIRMGIPRVQVRPPGGESYSDLWDRTAGFVREVIDAGENVAIVSHGGTCAVILAQLIQGTAETARSFRFGNTGIYELERRPDGYFSCLRVNDTRHLEAEIDSRMGATPGR